MLRVTVLICVALAWCVDASAGFAQAPSDRLATDFISKGFRVGRTDDTTFVAALGSEVNDCRAALFSAPFLNIKGEYVRNVALLEWLPAGADISAIRQRLHDEANADAEFVRSNSGDTIVSIAIAVPSAVDAEVIVRGSVGLHQIVSTTPKSP